VDRNLDDPAAKERAFEIQGGNFKLAGLVSRQMKELIVACYVPDPHLGELSQPANSRIGGKEVIESLEVARKKMVP
jgi:hypothetical protein